MPRPEDTKSRALRIDVPYHRRLHRLRAWDRLLTLLIPALAAGWLAFTYFVTEDESPFSSGPVSNRHAFFENDCAACHVTPFVAVQDKDCIACHDGPLHHDDMERAPSCASCHAEHAGVDELARTGDQHCVQCHDDLKLKTKDGALVAATRYDTQIETFIADLNNENDGHPEIALMKKVEKGAFKDQAKIRLNHREHMTKAVIYKDWNAPTLIEIKGQERRIEGFVSYEGDGAWVQERGGRITRYLRSQVTQVQPKGPPRRIQCNDCHEPDDSGQYMLPINYEKHCRDCHTLPASTTLSKLVKEVPIDGRNSQSLTIAAYMDQRQDLLRVLTRDGNSAVLVVPHEEFSFVRGYLQGTFEQLTREYRGKIFKQAPKTRGRGRKSKKPKPAKAIDPRVFIETRLIEVERSLYKNTCYYCHEDPDNELETFKLEITEETKADQTAAGRRGPLFIQGVAVPAPNIPDRWFEHTLFDHNAHRTVSCVSCHEGSGGKADPSLRIVTGDSPEEIKRKRDERFAEASTETTDVLLPKIGVCMDCHKPSGGARAGCVECHTYHDKSREKSTDGLIPLDQLIQRMNRGARRSDTGALDLLPDDFSRGLEKEAPPPGARPAKEGPGEDEPEASRPPAGEGKPGK